MSESLEYHRSLVMRSVLDRRRRNGLDEEQWIADYYLQLRHDIKIPSAPLKAIVQISAAIHRRHPEANVYELRDVIEEAVYQKDDTICFDERRFF